jgi:nucleotide-binding universal stress UspA family protein
MVTIQRLLCPVDFSEFSRHAVDHAVAIAHASGARITALHVLRPVASMIPAGDAGLYPPIVYTAEDLAQYTRALATFVAGSGGAIPLETVVVEGNPASEIPRYAADGRADLIVMGTHGRSGFQRLLLGSVTEHVLVKAHCPVLTVPRGAPEAGPAGPNLFTRILCAVDFSPASVKALAYARALAGQFGAALTVMHAVEPVPVFDPVMMGGPGTPEYALHARDIAQDRLHAVLAHADAVGDRVTEVVTEGKAYAEILRVAAERQADLIVIGAHAGQPGVLAFGSTMNHVVRGAECPVLTLKP